MQHRKFNNNNMAYRKVVSAATTLIQVMAVKNHLVSKTGTLIQACGLKKTAVSTSWETETLGTCINKANSFIHKALYTDY